MKRDDFVPVAPGFEATFGGCYAGRRVLVTGHTGFKGSWLVLWLRSLGAQVFGLALPATGALNHSRLLALPVAEALVDLRDAGALQRALQRFEPEIVFHLAAQPLVRRSYREPGATWATNLMGLVNLFEAVRATPSVRVLVNVTSDKCYAQREQREQHGPARQAFVEDDALGGHDPYSASKACAEIVSSSYRSSFFSHDDGRGHRVALATARAGNVIGGGDWGEDRLVPDLVRGAVAGHGTVIRHPQSTRPWQHVLDPLAGYLMLGARLWADPGDGGEAWNFGPDAAGHLAVGEVVAGLAAHWPALRCQPGEPLVQSAQQPPPHEAPWLALDCTKARTRLGWRPVWGIQTTLARTARWYRQQHEQRGLGTDEDLRQYIQDANTLGLAWAAGSTALRSVSAA